MKIIQAQPVKNKKINCWKYCVLSVEQCLFCVLHTVSTFEIDNKVRRYSLISPYGHLYNTDTSLLRTVRLVLEMPKIIHSLPLLNGHLCKLDTLLCPFGVRIKEVWLYAKELNDPKVLTKLAAGDMMAIADFFYTKCFVAY